MQSVNSPPEVATPDKLDAADSNRLCSSNYCCVIELMGPQLNTVTAHYFTVDEFFICMNSGEHENFSETFCASET